MTSCSTYCLGGARIEVAPIFDRDGYCEKLYWETRKSSAGGCAFEWMPERRLQDYLSDKVRKSSGNVKVFTLGTEGYGQDQQLLVLQEFYRSHRADMVVLWQTPGNDVWNNMFPTHWPTKNGWPKPTFRLINDELSGPTENMGDPVKPTNFKLARFAG